MAMLQFAGTDRKEDIKRNSVRALTKRFLQRVAASATLDSLDGLIQQTGKLREANLMVNVTAAAGESMTYDLQVNGATVLTGLTTVNNATVAKTEIAMSLNAASVNVVKGDIITLVTVYTAGGGPAPIKGSYVEVIIDPR